MKKKAKKPPSHPEVEGVLLLALGLIGLIACLTFSDQEPGKNWLGYLGYVVAYGGKYLFGFSIYLIPLYSIWLGVRFLLKSKISYLSYDHFYFSVLLGSCCLLLTLFADVFPEKARSFGHRVVSESLLVDRPYPHKVVRYNLGGVPAYFLYSDLPLIPLKKVVSPIGTALISFSLALVSFLLLTRVRFLSHLRAIGQGSWRVMKRMALYATEFEKAPEKPVHTKINFPEPKVAPVQKAPPKVFVEKTEKKIEKKVIEEVKLTGIPIQRPKHSPSFRNYQIPSAELLADARKKVDAPTLKKDLMKQAEVLEETLRSFNIEAKVGEINSGPTITSFEVHPSIGVKVKKIKELENDIALNMQAKSIRIIAPIPGKAAVGVEVPAIHPQEVNFKEMLLYYQQKQKKMNLPILIGKAVNGEWVSSDLSRMPHLLIAGATGSGKSVCINSIVVSLIMNASPDELQLLMIDPKKVELTQYSKLPHMIAPVITEARGAYAALQWLVKEMQNRYDLLKLLGLRNISSFNSRTVNKDFEASLNVPIPVQMPFIVAIIDEFADLMMVSSADLETPIARIAQMARAVGIHLLLATQRPSREVITGIIKANITCRIAFKVANRINSQIILDETGAESLLGNGDLLFLAPGTSQLLRAQGAYISDEEINQVIKSISLDHPPRYLIHSFDTMDLPSFDAPEKNGKESQSSDPLYDQALTVVLQTRSASTTFLQRKLKIGYARAASLMDMLEANRIISPQDGAKPRRILAGVDSGEEEEESEGND